MKAVLSTICQFHFCNKSDADVRLKGNKPVLLYDHDNFIRVTDSQTPPPTYRKSFSLFEEAGECCEPTNSIACPTACDTGCQNAN